MVGSLAGRLGVLASLAAGTIVVASAAMAPVAAAAAGMAGPPSATASSVGQARPDLQVTANGVEIDARGSTVYTFVVTNTGSGPAQNVKVTHLLQVKETATPQRVKKTITVREYERLAAGEVQTVAIVCEKSPSYVCEYGSVTATMADGETWAGDNYAAQGG